MTTRDLIYFVLFIASSCYSVFMYFLTLTDHVFITSEIPIHYTPIEAKVYVALTISTTFTFVITILLSEKSIIYITTSIFGIVSMLYAFGTIRTYYRFPDSIDLLTTLAMPMMFIIPTFLGVVIIVRRRKKKMNLSMFVQAVK